MWSCTGKVNEFPLRSKCNQVLKGDKQVRAILHIWILSALVEFKNKSSMGACTSLNYSPRFSLLAGRMASLTRLPGLCPRLQARRRRQELDVILANLQFGRLTHTLSNRVSCSIPWRAVNCCLMAETRSKLETQQEDVIHKFPHLSWNLQHETECSADSRTRGKVD